MRWRTWGLMAGVVAVAVASVAAFPWRTQLPVTPVTARASYPHDPQAFSQGLVIDGGTMYEGTGQHGASSLRQVELASGKVQRLIPLHQDYFGEGITILNGRLYQLTWKNRLAIVYDLETLNPVGSYRYSGEGWGLTTDGRELIMSDGSSTLRCLDPNTFEVTRRLEVRAGSQRIDKLNELEYVEGEILANIWYADRIARISPKTGEVMGWLDASSLYPAAKRPSREHVLNGIAYDADAKKLYLTGKMWPRLFEVEWRAGK